MLFLVDLSYRKVAISITDAFVFLGIIFYNIVVRCFIVVCYRKRQKNYELFCLKFGSIFVFIEMKYF